MTNTLFLQHIKIFDSDDIRNEHNKECNLK